jgi:hypothetical protein
MMIVIKMLPCLWLLLSPLKDARRPVPENQANIGAKIPDKLVLVEVSPKVITEP